MTTGGGTARVAWSFRRDPLRDGYVLAVAVWCILIGLGVVSGGSDTVGWYAYRLPDPYASREYTSGYGFFFTPPIAFPMWLLTLAGPTWFAAAMTALSLAALYVICGRWSALALLFPPVWYEVMSANVDLLIAAVTVVGFRHPALWAFPLLTKITPGIGLLWFAVRREWRSLGIALGTTAAIVLPTMLLVPGLWADWFATMTANASLSTGAVTGPADYTITVPLVLRLPVAALVVVWGGLTGRRWTVPLGAMLALPTLWFAGLSILVAVARLWWEGREASSQEASPQLRAYRCRSR
jgi:hypothetical protein